MPETPDFSGLPQHVRLQLAKNELANAVDTIGAAYNLTVAERATVVEAVLGQCQRVQFELVAVQLAQQSQEAAKQEA